MFEINSIYRKWSFFERANSLEYERICMYMDELGMGRLEEN